MNPETAKVTVSMTMPEFEQVFEVLKSYCDAYDAGAFSDLARAEQDQVGDKVRTIRALSFEFQEH